MKRIRLHISAWLLILLLGIPLLALGDDENPIIAWNNGGPVAALGFYFSEPLTVPFPGLEFDVTSVTIETTGNEFVIIWPSSGRFYYLGNYDEGLVYTDAYIDGMQVVIPMLSAKLIEMGTLDEIPDNPLVFDAPDDVNLHFEAILLDPLALLFGEEVIIKFEMLILDGEVVYVDITEQT
jgi:hypothetical protein